MSEQCICIDYQLINSWSKGSLGSCPLTIDGQHPNPTILALFDTDSNNNDDDNNKNNNDNDDNNDDNDNNDSNDDYYHYHYYW